MRIYVGPQLDERTGVTTPGGWREDTSARFGFAGQEASDIADRYNPERVKEREAWQWECQRRDFRD